MNSDRSFWNPAVEVLTPEEVRALQWTKLQKQLSYCYRKSSFYRRKFLDAGARLEDIRSIDDFRRLPIFLNKEEDRRSQQESQEREGHPLGMYLCAPLKKVIAVQATSGTTGDPTFYAFTRKDMRLFEEVSARGYWRCGVRPGEPVVHFMGLSLWIGGIPVIRGLHHLGARVIPVGVEGRTERLLQMICLHRPTTMICTPSYAEYLIEKAPPLSGKPAGALGLKRIICFGEPGAGLPEVRKRIQNAYGAELFDSGQGPWGVFIVSCRAALDPGLDLGMHVVGEDCTIMYDLVDPKTKEPLKVEDGAVGEYVFTALEWEAAPPLRYSLGDLCQIFTRQCACGQTSLRRKILGRLDDMSIIRGVNVFPSAIKNVVSSFPEATGDIRVVLEQPPPLAVPPLKVKVELRESLGEERRLELCTAMEKRLQALLKFQAQVILLGPGQLSKGVEQGRSKTPLVEAAYSG